LTCTVKGTNSVGNASAVSNGIFLLANGNASVDTSQGFAPSITIATLVNANILPTLAESVSPNIAVRADPYISSDYSPFLANIAISVTDGNTTLAESVTTTVAVVVGTEITGERLANVVNVPSVTYAYTDSIPVVVSNTAAVSNTQTWYVG
jgi:uridylate kinase